MPKQSYKFNESVNPTTEGNYNVIIISNIPDIPLPLGGESSGYNAMKEVEKYSFQDKKWEQLADIPVPCYYACATAYKGKILLYGSQAVPDANTAAQHDLQVCLFVSFIFKVMSLV